MVDYVFLTGQLQVYREEEVEVEWGAVQKGIY
jgi:hypothetical protein